MAKQTRTGAGLELVSGYRCWTDKAFLALLILALLINAVVFLAVLDVYPRLPERLPVLFNAQGQADFVANKAHLFRLPLGALLVTLFSCLASALLLRGSPFCARMAMLASCWTGLLLLGGLWFITA